ncbi:hypothetical protein LXA43DRAFT_147317 [Ganoderma leucocontextum]|nr:hypothetical protein LXA43DRAFT_147317 [Ganoderma leucocontextum]
MGSRDVCGRSSHQAFNHGRSLGCGLRLFCGNKRGKRLTVPLNVHVCVVARLGPGFSERRGVYLQGLDLKLKRRFRWASLRRLSFLHFASPSLLTPRDMAEPHFTLDSVLERFGTREALIDFLLDVEDVDKKKLMNIWVCFRMVYNELLPEFPSRRQDAISKEAGKAWKRQKRQNQISGSISFWTFTPSTKHVSRSTGERGGTSSHCRPPRNARPRRPHCRSRGRGLGRSAATLRGRRRPGLDLLPTLFKFAVRPLPLGLAPPVPLPSRGPHPPPRKRRLPLPPSSRLRPPSLFILPLSRRLWCRWKATLDGRHLKSLPPCPPLATPRSTVAST